jgi:hypothetical protein
MITLRGTYADHCNGVLPDTELKYAGRVMPYGHGRDIQYVNGGGQEVGVVDGDVLKICGRSSWFAHYTPDGTNDVSRMFTPDVTVVDPPHAETAPPSEFLGQHYETEPVVVNVAAESVN